MAVDLHGEGGGCVAEPFLDDAGVYPSADQPRCVEMAEVMEPQVGVARLSC